jgi:hypothetical protein
MTLIAAIRTRNGIALAADAQETVGSHRRSVQKLTPLPIQSDNLKVIVAGSGNADLIDSFTATLSRSILSYPIDNLDDFVQAVESELKSFYKEDVRLCTGARDFRLFIAASVLRSGEFDVWVTKNVRLVRMNPDYSLIGWDEPLYEVTLSRLCQKALTIQQAVLAATYAISIAEETCKEVKGPISVAVVTSAGIHMEGTAYVESISQRLRSYEREMNDILLSCSDTSISVSQLQLKLSRFANTACALHRSEIDEYVQNTPFELRTKGAYPKLPVPHVITYWVDGRITFEHDESVVAMRMATFPTGIKEAMKLPPLPPGASSMIELTREEEDAPQ